MPMPRQFIKNILHLSEIFYRINIGIALSLFFFFISPVIFLPYTHCINGKFLFAEITRVKKNIVLLVTWKIREISL